MAVINVGGGGFGVGQTFLNERARQRSQALQEQSLLQSQLLAKQRLAQSAFEFDAKLQQEQLRSSQAQFASIQNRGAANTNARFNALLRSGASERDRDFKAEQAQLGREFQANENTLNRNFDAAKLEASTRVQENQFQAREDRLERNEVSRNAEARQSRKDRLDLNSQNRQDELNVLDDQRREKVFGLHIKGFDERGRSLREEIEENEKTMATLGDPNDPETSAEDREDFLELMERNREKEHKIGQLRKEAQVEFENFGNELQSNGEPRISFKEEKFSDPSNIESDDFQIEARKEKDFNLSPRGRAIAKSSKNRKDENKRKDEFEDARLKNENLRVKISQDTLTDRQDAREGSKKAKEQKSKVALEAKKLKAAGPEKIVEFFANNNDISLKDLAETDKPLVAKLAYLGTIQSLSDAKSQLVGLEEENRTSDSKQLRKRAGSLGIEVNTAIKLLKADIKRRSKGGEKAEGGNLVAEIKQQRLETESKKKAEEERKKEFRKVIIEEANKAFKENPDISGPFRSILGRDLRKATSFNVGQKAPINDPKARGQLKDAVRARLMRRFGVKKGREIFKSFPKDGEEVSRTSRFSDFK